METSLRVNDKGQIELLIKHEGKNLIEIMPDEQTAISVLTKLRQEVEKKKIEDFDNNHVVNDNNIFGIDTNGLDKHSFGACALRWYEVPHNYRKVTLDRYIYVLKKWALPHLGKMFVYNIKRSDVKLILSKAYESGLSRSSVSCIRDAISNVFSHAMDEDIILDNPTHNILKRMNLEKKLKEIIPYTREETKIFLESAKNYNEQWVYVFFMIAFNTGARLGEIIPLTWEDINFVEITLKINKSFRRELIHTTKTGLVREVDLCDTLYNTLEAYKQQTTGDGVLFRGKKQEYYTQNQIRAYFNEIIKKNNLRKIKFHDIRHTYVSLMLSSGAKPHYVKKQVGHTEISMTVDRYGKWMPDDNSNEANKISFN